MDKVICEICKKEFNQMHSNHLKKHKMTYQEYLDKFPGSILVSDATHKKRSECISGDINPSKRQEVKDKISDKLKGRKITWDNTNSLRGLEEYHKKYGNPMKGKKRPDTKERMLNNNPMKNIKTRDSVSRTRKKLFSDGKLKIESKGWHHSEETKEKLRTISLNHWRNPDYVKKVLLSMDMKPNKKELFLLKIINESFDGFEFVGDGKTFIAGKVPDFINFNSRKIIELFGDYWHRNDNPETRISHFLKYNYECLVIWEHELQDTESLVNRLEEFICR